MLNFLKPSKSNINGVGIFTDDDISNGKIFYKVPVALISNKPVSRWAYIGNNRRVSDSILDNINHSCDANSILDISNNPILTAKRDIVSGEEITVDYNQSEIDGQKVLCTCGATNCRGFFLRIE